MRHVEKNLNQAIPSSQLITQPPIHIPKDHKGESGPPKRIRRKPKARADFVDINEALSNFAAEEVISNTTWSAITILKHILLCSF